MITQQISNLNPILASKSPRRQDLLKQLGVSYEVMSENVDEVYDENMTLQEVPEFLARLKLASLPQKYSNRLIISADTVVILGDQILGKPKDASDAVNMLQMLSGKMHRVISGVALAYQAKTWSFSEETKVYFKPLSKEEIEFYVNTYKPLDKAGSYGIQEFIGYLGVERIEGCFYNVMGLPVSALVEKIRRSIIRTS